MTKSQEVQLFEDEPKKVIQEVTLDTEDSWMSIQHNEKEICLSKENWLKLVDLAQQVIQATEKEN
ncbi:hypothetical protein CMT42_14875 [Elizabethkingia anophelis]|uniref:hypothetical protein n=1 Tax=Elizabethkingia TaxID=308865 RepID=UPI0006695553|nr:MULTISPECIES: hypothetical protein [Elizabethkingia]ATL43642.1 hypothetical protein CQS02_10210 [Elizabethkingia miricola]AQX12682.1 hypothetical protein BBD35_09990 [Elizabethkingia meningoseptica]MDV2459791.1 hypothetical protein [Elizabethkingia anophelis]MDV3669185.1 hypothetical protein [Elizabethkingia anophelis]MDV3894536.1 hypothetical protein [Elizabethkingia anophelis]